MTEEDVATSHKQYNNKKHAVVQQVKADLRARRRRIEMQAKRDDPFHRLHRTPLAHSVVSGELRPREQSVRHRKQRVNRARNNTMTIKKLRHQREGLSKNLSTSCSVLSRKFTNEDIQRARHGRLRRRYMKTAANKARNAQKKHEWQEYNQVRSFLKRQSVDFQYAKHRDKTRVVLSEANRKEEIRERIAARGQPSSPRKQTSLYKTSINTPDILQDRITSNEMSVRLRKRFVPKHMPLLAYRHFGEVHEPKVPPFASSALSRAAPVSIRVCDPVTGPTLDGFD